MALDLNGLTQDQQFAKAADYAGVPESVLRGQWKAESSNGKRMLSPAGAEGHFGIMPATRKTWEGRNGRSYDPNNFADALELAADTMKENVTATNGNIPDALRMYNSGTNRDHWDNPETNAYVPRVMGGDAPADYVGQGSAYKVHNPSGDPMTVEQVWNTSAYDLRQKGLADASGKYHKGELNSFESGAVSQVGMEAAAAAAASGLDPESASLAALQSGRGDPIGTMERLNERAEGTPQVALPMDDSNGYTALKATQDTIEAHQQEVDQRSNVTRFGDAMQDGTILGAIYNLSDNIASDQQFFKSQPGFDVLHDDVAKDIYKFANSQDDIDEMNVARSPQQLAAIQSQMQARRDRSVYRTEGVSGAAQTATTLLAGVMDAPGWVAGMGVSKSFQLAGMGSRAAFEAGLIGKGLRYAALEGAVGNVGITGAMDAMGQHQSTGDYAMATGMGLFMGGAMGSFEIFGHGGKAAQDAIIKNGHDAMAFSAETQARRAAEVYADLGPNVTKEQVQAEVVRREFKDLQREQDAFLADAPDADQMLPRISPESMTKLQEAASVNGSAPAEVGKARLFSAGEKLENGQTMWYKSDDQAALAAAATGNKVRYIDITEHPNMFAEGTPDSFPMPENVDSFAKDFTKPVDIADALAEAVPNAILNTGDKLDLAIKKYNLDNKVSNPLHRALIAEMAERAERWVKDNPVMMERQSKLLDKADFASTGQDLASEPNNIARMFAGVMAESASGMSGARRPTAALTADLMSKRYVGDTLLQERRLYENFRKNNGGSAWNDAIHGSKMQEAFDKRVYAVRDRRWNGRDKFEMEQDADVLRAADLYDHTYAPMLHDQIYARTPGSGNLNAEATRGFTRRLWNNTVVRKLTDPQYNAMLDAIQWQFRTLGGMDEAFAKKLAVPYLENVRREAVLGVDVPAQVYDPQALRGLEQVMRDQGLDEGVVAPIISRIGRGGASHTKTRLDLDLTKQFTDSDGSSFMLLDMMNTDQRSLLRNYAKRVSGEVSAAKYGVMGSHGLDLVRDAMEATGASARSLRALNQVSSELLGRPAKASTNLGTAVADLRHVARAMRLGGMGTQQIVEMTNASAALGIEAAARATASLPKLIRRAQLKAAGKEVKDGILSEMEKYGHDVGMEGYLVHDKYDSGDFGEVFGREKLSVLSRAARNLSHANRVMSGHRAILAAQQMGLTREAVIRAVRFMKEGGEDKALRDMGIDAGLQERMAANLNDWAKFDAQGNVEHIDFDKVAAKDAGDFILATKRGVSQIIQETFIGETGKWAHNDLLKLLADFRTFSITSVEKQWNRQVGVHGATKVIAYTLGAMSMALPIYLARVAAKGSTLDDDKRQEYMSNAMNPMVMGRAVMNYASTLGLAPDILDAVMSVAGKGDYAQAGRGSSTGGNFIGGTIAPAVGTLNDLVDLTTNHKLHTAYRLMPGGSNPLFHASVGLIREAADEVQK